MRFVFVDHVHGGEGPDGGVALRVPDQDVPGVARQGHGGRHHPRQHALQGGAQAGAAAQRVVPAWEQYADGDFECIIDSGVGDRI